MVEIVKGNQDASDETKLNPDWEMFVAILDDDVNLDKEDDTKNDSFDDIASHYWLNIN